MEEQVTVIAPLISYLRILSEVAAQCTFCKGLGAHIGAYSDVFPNIRSRIRYLEAENRCVQCLQNEHLGECQNNKHQRCHFCCLAGEKKDHHPTELCPQERWKFTPEWCQQFIQNPDPLSYS